MFLPLAHTHLDVYKVAGEIVLSVYSLTTTLPSIERFNLMQQMRRSALSVKLNIAEGASRRSPTERRRFYEIARGSLVELDTAIEVCVELDYFQEEKLRPLSMLLTRCFAMLSKMIA